MNDPETFLIEVYVLVDDLVPRLVPPDQHRPGPAPALSVSEVITLALMSRWARFRSERDFYRYAETRLRPLFPRLPSRTQFNRQLRRWSDLIAQIAVTLGHQLADKAAYEVLDSTAVPTRNAKRRGHGWLAGDADIGWSNRLGWYEGFHLLTCATPDGAVTGFGAGTASANDRHLAETFFAERAAPTSRLPSIGSPVANHYLADMGFGGQACEARWLTNYQATIVCPPQPDRRTRVWPPALRQWLIHHRQIIETVHARLISAFRLDAHRPHTLTGALTAIAASIAIHNVTILLNRRHGRPDLAYAEILGW